MQIQVLLFASYADALGAPAMSVVLPDEATVRDLLAHVHRMSTTALPRTPMIAINQVYAGPDDRIMPGDEVALIPPVAGG